MASRVMLIKANIHMERGGKPVKNNTATDRMPPMITCQPMATYFSVDCFNNIFHNAWMTAEAISNAIARIGITGLNLPHRTPPHYGGRNKYARKI